MPLVDSVQKVLPFLLSVFAICWVSLIIMLRLTKTVRIDVRNMRQWNGQRDPTLVIRGNSRGSKSHIPLQMLEDVTEVTFVGPWWKMSVVGADPEVRETKVKGHWWRRFLNLTDDKGPTPVSTQELFGYRGPGLRVTYRAPTLASGGEAYLWKQQFPANDPGRLKLILESGVAR